MSNDRSYHSSRVHSAVVQKLGRDIVSGVYDPGAALPTEDKLVAEFAISRAGVREAIKVLAGKGLVQSKTRTGTSVRPQDQWHLLDPDVLAWRYETTTSVRDYDDLTGMRLLIEPGAARLAAERISEELLKPIEAALEDMRTSVEDTEAFIEADLAFHSSIVAATDNDLLRHVNDMLWVALASQRHVHTRSKSRHKQTLAEHRAVLDAIRDGDPDAAEEAVRDLLARAQQDVLYYTGRSRRSGANFDPKTDKPH